MVEFAIIAPLLIFTWASINHFRNQYLMAQQVMHQSRTEAWAHATSGKCDTKLIPSTLAAVTLASIGALGDEAIGIFNALPGKGSFMQATATIDAKVGGTASKETGPYGFQSNEIGGRTYLHCNDKLPDPDDSLLLKLAPIELKELKVQP
jgi:hypothetical protein